MRRGRALAFVLVAAATAATLVAAAQPPKKAPKKPRPAAAADAGAGEAKDAGASSAREEKALAGAKDAGKGGEPVEAKTLDGGQRVFRFGEVEVEGRLKSPQIVYFLRRVRAEFAAGDLGHRSFMRELSETKNEPSF